MNSASVSSFPQEKQDRVDKAEAEKKNKQEAMLTTTSVLSTVDVQSVVQRWAAQSPCPFLTEIACVWGQTAPCEVTGQMLWSWDEMHGSRKSVSTGGFFFFLPEHTQLLSLTAEQLSTQTRLKLTKSFNDYT